ncbi:MAG: hypothetical protein VB135_00445 [Burkholderia sp.]
MNSSITQSAIDAGALALSQHSRGSEVPREEERRVVEVVLTAVLPHFGGPSVQVDVEALLAACVPGGSVVDPQVVADNIRAWAAGRLPGPQAPATDPPYGELPGQSSDLDMVADAARWRAVRPLLKVEWDEDEELGRWAWLDIDGDQPGIPSRGRMEYSSVDDAVDALIAESDEDREKRERLVDLIMNQAVGDLIMNQAVGDG